MGSVVVAHVQKPQFRLQGAHATFWNCKAPEVILSGPYETGKTITCLRKLNALLAKYPGSRALMVRQTYKSLVESAVVTWEKKIHRGQIDTPGYGITKYGGQRPEHYDYANGSRLALGGMDHPDKFLSSEWDFIYANQAEEFFLDAWEKLTGRATGRAGNAPYFQVFGDCNPGPPHHWIQTRDRLLVIETRHEDNPALYDGRQWTEQGRASLAVLDALTGLRYKRGRLGLWVAAEGQVYEFDPNIHLINRGDCPAFRRLCRSIDFGYTNPFVFQWWGEDYDGRIYLYREIYMTGRTVADHLPKINELSQGESYVVTVADHDAGDRATLSQGIKHPQTGQRLEPGIYTMPADKRVGVGIEKVQERLKVQGDGRPRLYIVRDCLVERDESLREVYKPVCTEEEFPGYVYPQTREGRAADEKPVKVDDHGLDALRYAVMRIERGVLEVF